MTAEPGRFHVVLLQPEGYAESMALMDVARLLHESFVSLGYECNLKINLVDPTAVNVLVGYHLIADPAPFRSFRYVVYQLEQIPEGGGFFTMKGLEVLRGASAVWDYSPENVAVLRANGLQNVHLVPLGFHEKLRTIQRAEQTTDVLFYGSLNDRRRAVLNALARSCDVRLLYGKFGEERDAEIAKAKIVLNIHFYDSQIMEQARVSYLLNNRCCVVSENSLVNPYVGGIAAVPYDHLVPETLRLLAAPEERFRLARAGFELLRSRPMTEYVRAAIGAAFG